MEGQNNQNLMEAQYNVFEKEQKEKNVENMMSFVISNAVLFRYFAEHLPKTLYKVWDEASKDNREHEHDKEINELHQHYAEFRTQIMSTLESLDPEAVSAFSDATDKADVDAAAAILHAYFEMKDKADCELEIERLVA